jgi:hypothetical protein
MELSTSKNQKRGRGRPNADTEALTLRVQKRVLSDLDAWIAAQPEPRPSRPEAIRRILAQALAPAARSLPVDELNASNDE